MLPEAYITGIVLAQGSTSTVEVLGWVLALIVLIVLGGLVILAMRRKLFSKEHAIGPESGLMDEMRSMHAKGELTDEEYDRIRKRLAAKVAGKDPEAVAARPIQGRPRVRAELRAKPGFDLTGAPLPKASDDHGESGEKKPGHDSEGFPEQTWPETSE